VCGGLTLSDWQQLLLLDLYESICLLLLLLLLEAMHFSLSLTD